MVRILMSAASGLTLVGDSMLWTRFGSNRNNNTEVRESMPIKCPQCGTENLDGALFCDECGASLTEVSAQPSAEAAPAEVAPTEAVPEAAPVEVVRLS